MMPPSTMPRPGGIADAAPSSRTTLGPAACGSMSQYALVIACHTPFRFGLAPDARAAGAAGAFVAGTCANTAVMTETVTQMIGTNIDLGAGVAIDSPGNPISWPQPQQPSCPRAWRRRACCTARNCLRG